MKPDRVSLIKEATRRARAILSERAQEKEDAQVQKETTELALTLQLHDEMMEAISQTKIDQTVFARVLAEAVERVKVALPEMPKIDVPTPQVTVNVPEVKVPPIVIPPFDIPTPQVTVNVPPQPAPIVNVPAQELILPDRFTVSLLDNTPLKPLYVHPVDAKGHTISPTQGGGGGGIKQAQIDSLKSNGVISNQNSSSAPLSASGVFTGQWEDVSAYSDLVVAVKTDQNGNFSVQYSPDGVNQDSTLTRYYRTTQTEAPHRFTNSRKYARVVFTNTSTTDQTYFRLQTILGTRGDLNAPMDSNLAQDFDSIVVRPTDYTTEVALGRRQGATTWNRFGFHDALTTTEQPIAHFNMTGTPNKVATHLEIVSTSTDDATGGTGLNTAIIYGVDQNWDTAIETVAMNGTTTVTTTSQWIGVNRVTIFQSGSAESNVGQINVLAVGSSTTMATVPIGLGTTQQMIHYIPRDHQFLATWLTLNTIKVAGGGDPDVTFKGYVYSDVVTSKFEVYRAHISTATELHVTETPPEPFVVGEKSILWFTADASAGTVDVAGRFSGKLIRDADA